MNKTTKITRLHSPQSKQVKANEQSQGLCDKLTEAMQKFESQDRFVTLGNVPVSVFADQSLISDLGLGDINFYDLVQIAPQEILNRTNNSEAVINKLTRLFNNLSDNSNSGAKDAGSLHTLYSRPASESGEPTKVEDRAGTLTFNIDQSAVQARLSALSSVAAEQMLTDACHRLRNHASFNKFSQLDLGSFWPSNIPIAPFIDSITFAQLVKMPLSNLLEKRTFSEQKVTAVLECIENVCKQYDSNIEPSKSINNYKSSKVNAVKKPLEKSLAIELQALLALLEEEQANIASYSWGAVFLKELNSTQIVMLLAADVYKIRDLQRITGFNAKKLNEILSAARKILAKSLEKQEPLLFSRWQALLKYLAVPLEMFFEELDAVYNKEFALLVLKSCLKAIGGQPVKISTWQNADFYTANAKGLKQVSVDLKVLSKRKNPQDFIKLCALCLPHLESKHIALLRKALS